MTSENLHYLHDFIACPNNLKIRDVYKYDILDEYNKFRSHIKHTPIETPDMYILRAYGTKLNINYPCSEMYLYHGYLYKIMNNTWTINLINEFNRMKAIYKAVKKHNNNNPEKKYMDKYYIGAVKPYVCYTQKPYYIICMQYIPDIITRSDIIKMYPDMDGRVKAICEIFIKVAEILRIIHNCGIVHCDLKPQNILLDCAGVVYIIDFGISYDRSNIKVSTAVTTVIITSPEHVLLLRDNLKNDISIVRKYISYESDIWALGVCIYNLIFDIYPFSWNKNSDVQILSGQFKKTCKNNIIYPLLEKIFVHATKRPNLDRIIYMLTLLANGNKID